MNILRSIFMAVALLTTSVSSLQVSHAASPFSNENLRYVISYKWGLIHKDAGEATLSLRRNGDKYNVMLAAKTKPWADKIYDVRDTLLGTIRVRDLKPLSYTKITHEKGKYAVDEIKYSMHGATTTGQARQLRFKNGTAQTKVKTLQATGPVYDMLSVFYYLRKLNYSQLNKNKVYTATVFSGSMKETVRIRSIGVEKLKLKNGTQREAYHIRFNFTSKGGKKTSDDIDTWISTDASHIPLYLVGRLPIGEVRAYFTGS